VGTAQTQPFRQAPPSTPWNPQLDLFLGAPHHPVATQAAPRNTPQTAPRHPPQGPLVTAEWQRQERLLARAARTGSWRRQAPVADALRPPPDTLPRPHEYPWAWPDFAWLTVRTARAREAAERSAPAGLQAPPQLEALAGLLQDLVEQVAWALSRPCPVYETRDLVRVEFLGCMAFVANRALRRMQLELRDAAGRWQLASLHFGFKRPLGETAWAEQVLLAWLQRIEALFGEGAAAAHGWLRGVLLNRFGRADCLQATERQIRHCLLTEPALARVLRRVGPYRPAGQSESQVYSELWSRAPLWAELEDKSPGLQLLYYLAVRQGQIPAGAHLGTLRARCRRLGLSPAGWRFLCRFGEWAYEGLLTLDPDYQVPFAEMVAYVEWQAAAGIRQPLPCVYAESLEIVDALHWLDDERVAVAADPRLARVTEAHVPGPHGGGREPIDIEEWHRLVTWLVNDRVQLDANQWRAGWPALRRAREAWLRRRPHLRWDSAVSPFAHEGWCVRPLTSGHDLIEEGRRMEHCADRYIRACHEGWYRLFTVECRESGAPVATIGLKHSKGKWRLDQVRGKTNGPAGEAIQALGEAVLRRYRKDG
jgi:hypothetical protein